MESIFTTTDKDAHCEIKQERNSSKTIAKLGKTMANRQNNYFHSMVDKVMRFLEDDYCCDDIGDE